MTYAYPTSESMIDSPMYLFYYLNEVTRGWFANMILITIYLLVVYTYYKTTDEAGAAMAADGFVTFIVSLLFWLSGFVATSTFIIVIAFMIVGVVALFIISS